MQGIGLRITKFLRPFGLEYLENSAVLARVRFRAVTGKGRFRGIFLVQMYYKYQGKGAKASHTKGSQGFLVIHSQKLVYNNNFKQNSMKLISTNQP